MHIVHRRAREVVVHHRRQVIDVQAPRREIRGHQHAQPARLEMRQRFGPTALTQFTVQRAGIDPRATKFLRHVLGGVFGRDKDERAAPAVFLHQMPQQLRSPQGIHLDGTFNNGRRLQHRRCHIDHPGFMQQPVGQRRDRRRKSRRKKQALAFGREQRHDPLQLLGKAEREQPIRFVQDEHGDRRKRHRIMSDQIQQPARRSHQYVNAATKSQHLGID